MKLSAVIFDLDGTVIKSEKVWGKAFVNVFKTLGVNIDNSHPQTGGVSLKNNWENLLVKYNIKTNKSSDELVVLTYIEYEKLISEITLNDGVLNFMDELKESGIQLVLATSTKWETTDKILTHFKLTDLFESVTTGDEVLYPKPAPDIFIAAAEKVNMDPSFCLVIEDSESGVMAAKDAGMHVIAITNGEENEDRLEQADLVVEGFAEITPKVTEGL